MSDALQKAIELVGGLTALGDRLNVSKAVVWAWRDRGSVPAEYCPSIEKTTAGAVRCEDLRPDIEWSVLRKKRGDKAVA